MAFVQCFLDLDFGKTSDLNQLYSAMPSLCSQDDRAGDKHGHLDGVQCLRTAAVSVKVCFYDTSIGPCLCRVSSVNVAELPRSASIETNQTELAKFENLFWDPEPSAGCWQKSRPRRIMNRLCNVNERYGFL